VSSVTLLCSACNEPTRVAMDFDDTGRKIRTCRKCGNET
jgi:ribosomal protein L24